MKRRQAKKCVERHFRPAGPWYPWPTWQRVLRTMLRCKLAYHGGGVWGRQVQRHAQSGHARDAARLRVWGRLGQRHGLVGGEAGRGQAEGRACRVGLGSERLNNPCALLSLC